MRAHIFEVHIEIWDVEAILHPFGICKGCRCPASIAVDGLQLTSENTVGTCSGGYLDRILPGTAIEHHTRYC